MIDIALSSINVNETYADLLFMWLIAIPLWFKKYFKLMLPMLRWSYIYIWYKSTLQIKCESDFCGIWVTCEEPNLFTSFFLIHLRALFMSILHTMKCTFKVQFDLSWHMVTSLKLLPNQVNKHLHYPPNIFMPLKNIDIAFHNPFLQTILTLLLISDQQPLIYCAHYRLVFML